MPRFSVDISRTIGVTVVLDAGTAEQALNTVTRADYPLPPRDEWTGFKDWRTVVCDADGTELLEAER